VGIHDDEVEAVARLAVPRSECRDQIAGNRTIVEGRELERGEPHLEWRPICIGQALHHRLDARHDPAQQIRSLRHAVGPKTVRPGSRDDIVQRIVGNLAGDPLRLEIGRGDSGPVGVVPRSLKEGEVVFDLVVGHQRFRNPVRRQQLVIAQFGNDLLLERHRQCLSSESLDLIRSTRTAARHPRQLDAASDRRQPTAGCGGRRRPSRRMGGDDGHSAIQFKRAGRALIAADRLVDHLGHAGHAFGEGDERLALGIRADQTP
jgi:hypothetical protein